ncbi:MAG: transporter ATP-binding protein [Bacillales bacterium]|jgi:ABC-2 type transport system ATP-binding protein|nr:transporter ATP-binding protein [Bacillales bacterium]
MIQMNNVSKKYDNQYALSNVHLQVKQASIYGLLGSNGAGKTTLLKVLSGIYKPTHGSVQIAGQEVFENIALKQDIFFIPDIPYSLPQYTIKQMANYYKSLYVNWSDERFEQLAKTIKIDVNKKIHRLSKGMQRQVAFWLAFSTMPRVLLLDEPMDGLDPVMRHHIRHLIIDEVAERKMTVIISSHNLNEVEDICDTVGILHEGKVLLESELDDLKSDIHKIQIAFKGEIPEGIFEKIELKSQEKRGSVILCVVRGDLEEIKRTLESFNPVLIDVLPLTLEEVFIHEMGGVGYEITNKMD